MDSEVRQKFEAWYGLPVEKLMDSFAAWQEAYRLGMRAGEIAQREFVIDLLDKRMRKMLDVDANDGEDAENLVRAECFHLMEIQRILRGEETCGVYDDYGKVPLPAAPEEKKTGALWG